MPSDRPIENSLVYFVDDEELACSLFTRYATKLRLSCRTFTTATDCLKAVQQKVPNLVVTDLNMPGTDGYELISNLRSEAPGLSILAITGQSTVERAVRAMQAGASDFLKKPYELRELELTVRRMLSQAALRTENQRLKRQLRQSLDGYGMIGDAPAMRSLYSTIDKLADVDCAVIIQGESGTGKELAARAIHDRGTRRSEPFVVIDCGAISDTLLESELFGHRRGAFTGADRERVGLLETAGAGTVFLDEIGNISDSMQTKLLRVLQERVVTPVGSNRTVPLRARFITATHRDLGVLVAEGAFRHDLYHRLNVVSFKMPSLADRRQDIPLLIGHFVEVFSTRYNRPTRGFSGAYMEALCRRSWEGNVRELRNFVERRVIMSDGELLDPEGESPAPLARPAESSSTRAMETLWSDELLPLDELESRYIDHVLEQVDGNQRLAAEILGINRTTLWRKLRQADVSDG